MKINYLNMELDIGQKTNKLSQAMKKLQMNSFKNHAKITEFKGVNDRPAKIETYIRKSSNCLQNTIEKKDDFKLLCMLSKTAAETNNHLEFYLESITAKMTI